MKLTEQHIIKTNEWRDWCVKAKNLYNQSLYYWRQSIFGEIEYFDEYELLGLFRKFKEENYIQLPSHCGQEIIRILFNDIKSWQKARKEYNKNPHKFLGRPKMPKYKKELSILQFNNEQVRLKSGFIHFPGKMGMTPIKTKIPNGTKVNSGRVIPKANHFVVEFVYTVEDVEMKEYNNKAMGIDLGLNNLATCISTNNQSFIINGRPLKSVNQHYNKQKAKSQSLLPKNKFTSNKIQKLTLNRNNKIKNYLHNASKYIVNKSVELDITKIIIGHNKEWKNEINLGSKSNQNFVQIPHSNLIKLIEYKAKMVGIEVIETEESYTSKCSALDLEPICKHETYVGRRVKRGLFKTADGTKINADCNGAINILRKVIGDDFLIRFDKRAVKAPNKINTFEQSAQLKEVFKYWNKK